VVVLRRLACSCGVSVLLELTEFLFGDARGEVVLFGVGYGQQWVLGVGAFELFAVSNVGALTRCLGARRVVWGLLFAPLDNCRFEPLRVGGCVL